MNFIARISINCVLLLAPACLEAYAANPYLNAIDDKPHSVWFHGTQWGDGRFDDPDTNGEKVPLTAKVVTTRIAKTDWGGIYKIAFENIKPPGRKFKPDCYAVTDDYIFLINDIDVTVKSLSMSKTPPPYTKDFVRALNKGSLNFVDGLWTTEVKVKGDICTYNCHHNSGHYATLTWKKGVGLIGCASNYGAQADGYSLKVAK
jgi:hypothetical protein